MPRKRPNFVVIMTDQQRADHLGCYGNPIVQTPNIDALANNGVRFDQFYVSNPICQPNRAALATGQMTSVNGCRQNGIPISLDSTTYADVMRSAGFKTGLVGKAHFQNVTNIPSPLRLPSGSGDAIDPPYDLTLRAQRSGPSYRNEVRTDWAQKPDRALSLPYYGFDHVRLCIGHGDQVEGHYSGWLRDALNGEPDPRGRENAKSNSDNDDAQVWRTSLPAELYPTTYVRDEAISYLQQQTDEPFLLVVSFPDPHHPFTPPGQYFDMYNPADIPLPASFEHKTKDRTDLPEYMTEAYNVGDDNPNAYWPFHPNADHLRQMIALNYGAISMIDDAVGSIVHSLSELELAEDTVICFMSDHGDYMGDHGTILKHGVHSQGVIRVPFIWSDPHESGRSSTNLQGSAIDFAPTLLQRAGLKIPVGMQGVDLLAKAKRNLPVLVEDSGMGIYKDPNARTAIRTIVHQGWRMSLFEGSDLGELFHLTEDPNELVNLWHSDDPVCVATKAEFLQLLVQRQLDLRDRSLLAPNQA